MKNRGVQFGLLSALLFGAGTPVAKLLLADSSPWLLAGLLYIGSGLGLSCFQLIRRAPKLSLSRSDWPWLAAAVGFGGVAGPVLLMFGLSGLAASEASLLLNAEAVLTAVIAWVVFREHVQRRILLGMACIVAGAVVLTVPDGASLGNLRPSLAIVGACLCWAIDNNLTRKLALHDAVWLAAIKGGVAGPVNLILAFVLGAALPPWGNMVGTMVVGLIAYGVSLVLFIVAMRYVGTARAGAYYSVAPFFGATLALAMGAPMTWPLVVAAVLMGAGVWLHVSERHSHPHAHEAMTHEHWHTHDDGHHTHNHVPPIPAGVGHTHVHSHEPVTHNHPHFPDEHHRHGHTETQPRRSQPGRTET